MVSYIFLSPHAFLVGPVQGVQGTRLHNEPQFLLKITHFVTCCGMRFSRSGCQWHWGYDRPARHNTSTNPQATSFLILSEPFYISDLSECLSYGSLLLEQSWMLAMACLLTAIILANGPHHHESSQYPQSLGINLQRFEESWRLSFLSTNEWYWKTRDHHTCLHARPYIGDLLVYD